MLEQIFKFMIFLLHRPLKTLTERTSWINRWSRKVRDVERKHFCCYNFHRIYRTWHKIKINNLAKTYVCVTYVRNFTSKHEIWPILIQGMQNLSYRYLYRATPHAGPGPAVDQTHNASYVVFFFFWHNSRQTATVRGVAGVERSRQPVCRWQAARRLWWCALI